MTLPVNLKFPSPGNIVFFSISKDNDLVHSYNGGGQDLHALALDWLAKAKCHHVWHSHTEANRTAGFLMRDGYTFFAIDDDAGAGNAKMLAFLERLRDAYRNAPPKEGGVVGEEINCVVWVRSGGEKPKAVYRPKDYIDDRAPKVEATQSSSPTGGAISSSRSSSSRLVMQQRARKLWRQVKIVAAVDLLLCLTMFTIRLVVCEGFQCVSEGRSKTGTPFIKLRRHKSDRRAYHPLLF